MKRAETGRKRMVPAHAPEPRVERRSDGQLRARLGERLVPVWVRHCFPWSSPTRFVSLRDGDGAEVAFVEDVAALEPASRVALLHALAEAGFVLDVQAVHEVEDEVEIRRFRVETRQGARSFQTHRDEWPRRLPGGGFLLRDVAGDLYRVRSPRTLDRRSRRLLWALVD